MLPPPDVADFYAETLVRPLDDTRLTSCALAIGSTIEQPLLITVGKREDDATAYAVEVAATVISQDTFPGNRRQSGTIFTGTSLQSVMRWSLLGQSYSSWTKVAAYRSGDTIQVLVNDRLAGSFQHGFRDTDGMDHIYPQLAIRAGTKSAGGVAACEFDYLKVYAPH